MSYIPTPTIENDSNFLGWYKDGSNGELMLTNNLTINENVLFVARWSFYIVKCSYGINDYQYGYGESYGLGTYDVYIDCVLERNKKIKINHGETLNIEATQERAKFGYYSNQTYYIFKKWSLEIDGLKIYNNYQIEAIYTETNGYVVTFYTISYGNSSIMYRIFVPENYILQNFPKVGDGCYGWANFEQPIQQNWTDEGSFEVFKDATYINLTDVPIRQSYNLYSWDHPTKTTVCCQFEDKGYIDVYATFSPSDGWDVHYVSTIIAGENGTYYCSLDIPFRSYFEFPTIKFSRSDYSFDGWYNKKGDRIEAIDDYFGSYITIEPRITVL